jgi:hypothetical protein
VLILKKVKVIYFVTLLQVLILKVVSGGQVGPLFRLGLGEDLAPPTTPAFCKKSPQTIENKGKELQKQRQEISRARKLLIRKHLEVWTE